MIISIHQPEHLPWLGFFNKLASSDIFILLDNVPFRKNYFQNRNRIRTKEGWIWLTVPILTKDKFGQKINEVMIDNSLNWQRKHLLSIEQNYGRALYFDEYKDFFLQLYNRDWQRLVELNTELIRCLSSSLGIKTRIIEASSLNISGSSTDLLLAICKEVGAKIYISGRFGRDYLDESKFAQEGIKIVYQEFHHPEYKQVFETFIPDMSALDLLFNYGKNGGKMLYPNKSGF